MKLNILFAALLAGLAAASCGEETVSIKPSDISNPRTEERPGAIAIFWDLPSDGSVYYVKVKYRDHLLGIDETRLSSCDSILIPDTRAKFGEYSFTLQPFSRSDDGGSELSVKGVSGRAPVSYGQATQVELTVDDLSTNAQEPWEGPIANLLDGSTATFFHTIWSGWVDPPHWLQIRLPQTLKDGFFRFHYGPRDGNARQRPIDFDLLGSSDGENWTLIKNFTKEADGLPVTSTDWYRSPNIPVTFPLAHIRISVNDVNSHDTCFSMGEFQLFTGPMVDPEAE